MLPRVMLALPYNGQSPDGYTGKAAKECEPGCHSISQTMYTAMDYFVFRGPQFMAFSLPLSCFKIHKWTGASACGVGQEEQHLPCPGLACSCCPFPRDHCHVSPFSKPISVYL